VPAAIPLSSEHVTDEGIYLLENGDDALIYVGNSVDADILSKLFGTSSVDEIPTQVIWFHANSCLKIVFLRIYI